MAFSNSNDFDQTAQTLIKDALIIVGGLEDNEEPSNEQLVFCLRALNRMCKSWSKRGLRAWCWNSVTLNLTTAKQSYTIGPSGDLTTERPLEIRNVRKVISGDETPIRMFSRQEYMDQPSKTTTGEPIAVFYDPQLTNGVLYVWQSPETGQSLKFDIKQYIDDFDNQTNNPYFPAEWLDAIIYNLALRLAPKYEMGIEERMWLQEQASEMLQNAEESDNESGSIFLGVEQ